MSATAAPPRSRQRPTVANGERVAPRAGAERRPALRIVDDPVGRRRVSGLLWISAAVVLAILLLTVAVHIVLVSGQRQLDRTRAELDAARMRHEELRRQEAELRTPAEIGRIATERLGMVPAARPVILTPAPQVLGIPPIPGASGAVTTTTVAGAGG